MDVNGRLGAIVDKRTAELLELRRTLHQHPELAFEEHETAKAVSGFLTRLGIPHKTGVGKTGIVATLEGSRPGRTVGIRADMDALPITEETGLPFASKNPGKMHACGHDVHTAIALGVAATLSEMRDVLPGRIKFIFQPGEESLLGALAMIKDGVLDEQPKLDALLGYHNWPPLRAGTVGYHPENVMSSADAFDVIIKGRGGHAAHPHLAIDALAAAAYFVTQVQTVISREIAPLSPAVISIGEMHAGTVRNVVASSAELKGSVRTQEPGLSEKIEAAVRRPLDGIETGMRVEATLNWQKGVPVLRNDKAVLERVLNAARDTLGAENVINLNQATMGSEDFAWFAQRVPTAHLRIGSKIDGLDTAIHRSNYDSHDLTIPTGVKVMARAALDLAKG